MDKFGFGKSKNKEDKDKTPKASSFSSLAPKLRSLLGVTPDSDEFRSKSACSGCLMPNTSSTSSSSGASTSLSPKEAAAAEKRAKKELDKESKRLEKERKEAAKEAKKREKEEKKREKESKRNNPSPADSLPADWIIKEHFFHNKNNEKESATVPQYLDASGIYVGPSSSSAAATSTGTSAGASTSTSRNTKFILKYTTPLTPRRDLYIESHHQRAIGYYDEETRLKIARSKAAAAASAAANKEEAKGEDEDKGDGGHDGGPPAGAHEDQE